MPIEVTRPMARGYIHFFAFFIALCACALLILNSHSSRALLSNIVYSFTLIGLFGVSALYHRKLWTREKYLLMKKVDHAAIFILIAGTATPICLLGLRDVAGLHLITLLWLTAVIGMVIVAIWTQSPKWLRAILYIIMGWLAVIYFPEFKNLLGIHNLELLLTGGILYTLGALIYAFKYPNPLPVVFGYHEVFHVFVVIASGFHFALIYNLTI